MNISNLLSLLWRKKWVLIIVPIIAVAAAFVIRITGEWRYKSTSLLSTGLTVSDELTPGSKYLNPYEVQVTFNNLIEIIKSRAVIDQVGYKVALHDFENKITPYRKPKQEDLNKISFTSDKDLDQYIPLLQKSNETLTLLDATNLQEKRLTQVLEAYGYDYESLIKQLSVSRVNQSDFIEVSFISENPQLSAFVVNTLCGEFVRYYSSIKKSRSNSSVASLEVIAAQRKKYLDDKLQELQLFKSSTDIINSTAESEAKIRQIKTLEERIANENEKIRGLELTIEGIDKRLNNAPVTGTSSRNFEIVNLRNKLDRINAAYIRGGHKDKVLEDSLSLLKRQLDDALNTNYEISGTLSQEVTNELKERREESTISLNIATENLASLTKVYNSLRYSLGDFANKESLGSALEKEVEVAREEYLSAQNKLNEAREKMIVNTLAISQVLKAEPPDKVESKKTLLFMVFSGAISFMLSAFVIIAIELMDSRIKSPQRFKVLTRLKLAGVLPKLHSGKNRENKNRDKEKVNSLFVNARSNDELRKIRFEIEAHKPRVILVTSTKPSQGKTFFIKALSYAFSLKKKRVLIIDTNFRNNSLTEMFVAQPALKALLETFKNSRKLLTGAPGADAEPEAPKTNLISATQNSWVDVIGNKKSQTSPSEMIPDHDFNVFLEWLKMQYDYILMEGPALNQYSDTKELISYVDVVVPVFSADSSFDTEDAESLNFLKSLQGKLGPAVLNNFEKEK
jgi:polysaccharide biosynthesis transport protein